MIDALGVDLHPGSFEVRRIGGSLGYLPHRISPEYATFDAISRIASVRLE